MQRLWEQIKQDDIVTKLAGKGFNALVIKVASAGLSYLMFLLLARWMTPQEYGEFAMAFSFGSFLAFVALRGQHLMVLRYIPQYEGQGKPALAAGILVHSRRQLLIGTAWTVALTLAALAILDTRFGWAPGDRTLYMGAIFAAPFAYAQYQSHLLRAFGSINRALIPMDVAWRLAVPAAVYAALTLDLPTSSGAVMLIASALLGGITAWQWLRDEKHVGKRLNENKQICEVGYDVDEWYHTKNGLWGITTIGAIIPQLTTVIVGISLSANDAGIFFAALKTSQLLGVLVVACNISTAPIISKYWGKKEYKSIIKIWIYSILFCFFCAINFLLFIFYFGQHLLSFFNVDTDTTYRLLQILIMGQALQALLGCADVGLENTGGERSCLAANVYTIIASITAAVLFGILSYDLYTIAYIISARIVSYKIFCAVAFLIHVRSKADQYSNSKTV